MSCLMSAITLYDIVLNEIKMKYSIALESFHFKISVNYSERISFLYKVLLIHW